MAGIVARNAPSPQPQLTGGKAATLELAPFGGRFVAWESSRVIVLDSRVTHGAAAGPIQAKGERPGG